MRGVISISVSQILVAAAIGLAQESPAGNAEPTGSSNNAGNWAQFRGPEAAGLAVGYEALPVRFGPDENLLWRTQLPAGVSSPCVWGNRIFLTCFDEENQQLETVCVDRSSGELLWRRPVEAKEIEEVHEVSSPANATPVADGQRVYVFFNSCGVYCYDFDGEELWRRPLELTRIAFGNGTSPAVIDGRLILNLDDGGKSIRTADGKWERVDITARVAAFDCETGETIWETAREGNARRYATPVTWRGAGRSDVLILGGGQLAGYDLVTGERVWWCNGLPANLCATPLVTDNRVVVTGVQAYGEAEAFVGIPSYDELVEQWDADGDGLVTMAELPDDALIMDRRASRGAGNAKLVQFAGGIPKDDEGRLAKEPWEERRAMVTQFLTSDPGMYSIRLGGIGDVTETHVEWKETKGVTEVPTPLEYRNRLYNVRNGGILHCRDPHTGRHHFRGRLGAAGGYYASPVAGDGKIYFASDRGVVTVLAAGDELKVLARNDLGERIMATPALVDGTAYVRTDEALYAFSGAP